MKEKLMKWNLFRKEVSVSRMENVNEVAVIATRFYLVLLTCSMLVLTLFNSLDQKTVTVTVQSPSRDTFESLQQIYPATLWCPCEQIGISYGAVLSVSYHQVNYKINQFPIN
jgi:hypothetical protein